MLASYTVAKLLDDASQVVNYIGAAGTKQDTLLPEMRKVRLFAGCAAAIRGQLHIRNPGWQGTDLPGPNPEGCRFRSRRLADERHRDLPERSADSAQQRRQHYRPEQPGNRPTDNGQKPQRTGAIVNRLNEYFVPIGFFADPNFMFGNVGRFLPNVRNPGQHNLDFSLFKTFKPTEKVQLQFRAEASTSPTLPRGARPAPP